ncbi:hypothetical protein UFOVP585_29 [uncultured Caudovirales phage]|uniref:Uncharacterized protein n=1 Tax=uncultured Caudovirales phage TaxID=2100421 RepID=A0A6J5N030_9CAUD|nr:hypothetical protein UFOVP585_29 [uncultured Caudovirales phage]
MIRFLTFSQFHNKNPVAGSTQIRVNQLLKYWPDAELYLYGENPDVLIFQKVYIAVDYQFPLHFEGIKILDICDPDWLDGRTTVKEMADAMDAVTCPTEAIAEFIRQFTDKPVIVIPDRFDLSIIPARKKHTGIAKTVVWFGYSHNAEILRYALPVLQELGLKLRIISDNDPIINRYSERDANEYYKFIKYDEDTIYDELRKADIALIPKGARPHDVFKSNNRTVKSILAGLPVASTADKLRELMKPEAREAEVDSVYNQTWKEYDVKKSVLEYKGLIRLLERKRAEKQQT